MGSWAEGQFGKASFDSVGIVLGGHNDEKFQKEILDSFDEVVSSKHRIWDAYVCRKGDRQYAVVFNVYGAPAALDIVAYMHDGGCRNIIFVGYAYAVDAKLTVGEVVLPTKSYHFEGVYHPVAPDRDVALPDKELMQKLLELTEKYDMKHTKGTNISVPAVTFQRQHANEDYKKIKPTTVEMELAACYARANDIGIRAAGALVISDTRSSSIANKEFRRTAKLELLKHIISDIASFELPKIPREKEFVINEYLADIIHDPDDPTNVYRG